jgi:hypothetical protein
MENSSVASYGIEIPEKFTVVSNNFKNYCLDAHRMLKIMMLDAQPFMNENINSIHSFHEHLNFCLNYINNCYMSLETEEQDEMLRRCEEQNSLYQEADEEAKRMITGDVDFSSESDEDDENEVVEMKKSYTPNSAWENGSPNISKDIVSIPSKVEFKSPPAKKLVIFISPNAGYAIAFPKFIENTIEQWKKTGDKSIVAVKKFMTMDYEDKLDYYPTICGRYYFYLTRKCNKILKRITDEDFDEKKHCSSCGNACHARPFTTCEKDKYQNCQCASCITRKDVAERTCSCKVCICIESD